MTFQNACSCVSPQLCVFALCWACLYHFNSTFRVPESSCTTVCHVCAQVLDHAPTKRLPVFQLPYLRLQENNISGTLPNSWSFAGETVSYLLDAMHCPDSLYEHLCGGLQLSHCSSLHLTHAATCTLLMQLPTPYSFGSTAINCYSSIVCITLQYSACCVRCLRVAIAKGIYTCPIVQMKTLNSSR